MLIWIFNTMNEALQFLRWKEPKIWDRIIILGGDQTTHEYQEWGWKNINGIYLKGEKGQSGTDGKNGRDAKEVDTGTLFNQLYEKLKLDEAFAKKVKWEKWEKGDRWEKWEDFKPDIAILTETIISQLINYAPFIEKIKGKDGKDGKDGQDWVGIPGKDWKDWTNGLDGMMGRDWWEVIFLENTNDIELDARQLGVDSYGTLYINKNNTILSLKQQPWQPSTQ